MDGGKRSQAQLDLPTEMGFEVVERERLAISRLGRLHVFHWLVVIISVVVTIAAWQYSKYQVDLRTNARFDFAANQVTDLLRERLQKYELALWAGVAAANVLNGNLDDKGWQIFARNLEIEQRYPGINGIGVIYQLSKDELKPYLDRQRRTRPDFTNYPEHGRDIYQPITFIEPVETNAAAVGLDMVHETNRHTSFNKSRDTGLAQITGPIVLVQDSEKTPGFLFFAPFYRNGPITTPEERQSNFIGTVYAPFVVNNLMDGVLGRDRRSTTIRIEDAGEIIYDEIHEGDFDYDDDTLAHEQISLPLYGRVWDIDIRAGLEFRAENSGFESSAILVIGLLVDTALLTLFILLTRANRRGLRFADMATAALKTESTALKVANQELETARENAETVSEMKSLFLSTMSHEVRTPLNAIGGMFELLERAGLPERQAKLVKAGQLAAERLIKLLTNVLDVSRLEAQAVELWEREIALRPLMEEWRMLATGIVENSGADLAIKTDVAADVPEAVLADDIRLSQVMNNLLDNAIRFTKRGSITISVSSEPLAENDQQLIVLKVIDTGIGIAEQDLDLIFDRFKQADGSITRDTGGSGLGLAICHDLVKLMHGEISVESAVGIGSTFAVRLPLQVASKQGEY